MSQGLSEFGLIRNIQKINSRQRDKSVYVGIGDDAAVLKSSRGFLLVTTDMLVEGVHFRRDWMSPREIGDKAMAVNLSDIAAMGGRPRWAVVSVGLPRGYSEGQALELFRGLSSRASRSQTILVGGDTNAARDLTINVTLMGEVGHGGPILRSGARVGDFIYVTGVLGGSALGLAALKRWGRKKCPRKLRPFISRHVHVPDRLKVGCWLQRRASSLIDLSDGLLGDLGHILEMSSVGAEIWVEAVPVVPPLCFTEGFEGGEDYELLFTAPMTKKIPKKIAGVPITRIGRILPQRKGLSLVDASGSYRRVAPRGFTHFRS